MRASLHRDVGEIDGDYRPGRKPGRKIDRRIGVRVGASRHRVAFESHTNETSSGEGSSEITFERR